MFSAPSFHPFPLLSSRFGSALFTARRPNAHLVGGGATNWLRVEMLEPSDGAQTLAGHVLALGLRVLISKMKTVVVPTP